MLSNRRTPGPQRRKEFELSIPYLPKLFKGHHVREHQRIATERRLLTFVLLLALAGCGTPATPPEPLLTNCILPTISTGVALGIGRDGFVATEALGQALIVGGYQGGHHLWGALRFQGLASIDATRRLHIIACKDDEIIAEALYSSIGSLLKSQTDLYGIPVVFGPTIDVATLDTQSVSLIAGVETANQVTFSSVELSLKCCGHVADGD